MDFGGEGRGGGDAGGGGGGGSRKCAGPNRRGPSERAVGEEAADEEKEYPYYDGFRPISSSRVSPAVRRGGSWEGKRNYQRATTKVSLQLRRIYETVPVMCTSVVDLPILLASMHSSIRVLVIPSTCMCMHPDLQYAYYE